MMHVYIHLKVVAHGYRFDVCTFALDPYPSSSSSSSVRNSAAYPVAILSIIS